MNTNLITLPPEVESLALKVNETKKAEVGFILNQIFTGTEDWWRQIESIVVKDVNDKLSMDMADTARKNVKNARLNAVKIFDAKRDEVKKAKEDFDLEDKLWLKAKQIMEITFKAIEDKAEWKANFAKRAEKLAKAPIKNQLLKWVESFDLSKTSIENDKVQIIKDKFNSFKNWAKKEIEGI